MKEISKEKLRGMESNARNLAGKIDQHMSIASTEHYGFALVLFSFEGPELTYVSNAERADMINALEELVGNLKRGSEGTARESAVDAFIRGRNATQTETVYKRDKK